MTDASGMRVATRFALAQGIVVTAGVLTAIVVAALAGPPLFHEHMIAAGHPADSTELTHVESAYLSANAIALSAALGIALVAAFAVTWYLTRRITAPLTELAAVATRLSEGDYTARAADYRAGPELHRLTTTFNDVAERLQVTEDTRRRLLGDLAHELRTPLATVQAYLEGLEDGVTTWGPDTARVLRDQTDRLVRLALDIGEVSRVEEGHLDLDVQMLDVHELIEAAADGVRADYVAKGVTLVVAGRRTAPFAAGTVTGAPTTSAASATPAASASSVTSTSGGPANIQGSAAETNPTPDSGPALGPATVAADRQRILQALTNLLTNALRHSADGDAVRVTASVAGQSVRIEVADTGEGIAPEQLPHIFERFYRGDSARSRDHGGSGIGLTIARRIAAAHGGTLTATSAGLGHGATFRLTLPSAPAGQDSGVLPAKIQG